MVNVRKDVRRSSFVDSSFEKILLIVLTLFSVIILFVSSSFGADVDTLKQLVKRGIEFAYSQGYTMKNREVCVYIKDSFTLEFEKKGLGRFGSLFADNMYDACLIGIYDAKTYQKPVHYKELMQKVEEAFSEEM